MKLRYGINGMVLTNGSKTEAAQLFARQANVCISARTVLDGISRSVGRLAEGSLEEVSPSLL
jgi:hypothetical protein